MARTEPGPREKALRAMRDQVVERACDRFNEAMDNLTHPASAIASTLRNETEIAALRAEVSRLKKELARALVAAAR